MLFRERHFGDLELGPDRRYDEVWTAEVRALQQKTC